MMLATLGCVGCGGAASNTATVAHFHKARKKSGSAAQQRLTVAVAPLVKADGGHVAVAVSDLTTGAEAPCNGTQLFDTASIVKVDLLAALLYQRQQAGQTLTAEDEDLATTMIENSDNDSATDLDGYWGLTTTTAQDQVRLLREAMTIPSPLSPASRAYIQGLMNNVEADQEWDVSAAASTAAAPRIPASARSRPSPARRPTLSRAVRAG